jgi:hypothetical protein
MASNWNLAAAQQNPGKSTLRKNVLPIKGHDTHRYLLSFAAWLYSMLPRPTCIVRERSNSFKQPGSSGALISLLTAEYWSVLLWLSRRAKL